MLLSAFAYAHFVNLADPDTKDKMAAEAAKASAILGVYDYKTEDFFGGSNAVLTNYARQEIAEILTLQPDRLLSISVPTVAVTQDGQRLRQWEKVAARSAAIADAFEKEGQDGEMIVLQMPDKLVSKADDKRKITLTFLAPDNGASDK